VLLANHGIVCWADTVTHAEWYAEVLDTYCWTLMLAQQLGAPITFIPEDKAADLLAIKKRLGLPDARLDGGMRECQLCDLPEMAGAIALPPPSPDGRSCSCGDDTDDRGRGHRRGDGGARVGSPDGTPPVAAARSDVARR
jgi:hypothetical protein